MSLAAPLAALGEMDLVRRETPFGSDPKSGKRSLYQIADPSLRFWFRVVAPNRSLLAEASRETRLLCWQRHRTRLEAYAWEELCRMAVPALHRIVPEVAADGPFGNAQRFWRANAPQVDIVARSVAGADLLIGEAKWTVRGDSPDAAGRRLDALPLQGAPVRTFLFTPDAPDGAHGAIGARDVLKALR